MCFGGKRSQSHRRNLSSRAAEPKLFQELEKTHCGFHRRFLNFVIEFTGQFLKSSELCFPETSEDDPSQFRGWTLPHVILVRNKSHLQGVRQVQTSLGDELFLNRFGRLA